MHRCCRRPASALLTLALLISNTACYHYQPVDGVARPGGVRFELTSDGTTKLAQYLGPAVHSITGDLVEWRAGDTLVVIPRWVRTTNGVAQPWIGEGAVSIARADLLALDERRFNRRRTTLAATLVTVGLVAIALAALNARGAHGDVSAGGGAPVR